MFRGELRTKMGKQHECLASTPMLVVMLFAFFDNVFFFSLIRFKWRSSGIETSSVLSRLFEWSLLRSNIRPQEALDVRCEHDYNCRPRRGFHMALHLIAHKCETTSRICQRNGTKRNERKDSIVYSDAEQAGRHLTCVVVFFFSSSSTRENALRLDGLPWKSREEPKKKNKF